MKKIICFLFAITVLQGYSQNNVGKLDDIGRISLTAFVPENIDGMPAMAKKNLENKLQQIATKNGLGGGVNNRFIISANVIVLTKDVTATAPPMQAYTIEVSLYIGDGIEGKAFSNTSITLKGVGETETKAYMAALKKLKATDSRYQSFIEEGKSKIIQYYNSQCDFIIKNAQTLAGQDKFEDAITTLVTVPEVCKECYDKAMDASVDIYRQKLEKDCQKNITMAEAEIAADNWTEVLAYLVGYTPDMQCYVRVKELVTQIQDHRCAEELSQARVAWIANQDSQTAASHLANIPADSRCYEEAIALQIEIQDHRCADDMAKAQAAWISRDSQTAISHLANVTADSKCYEEAKVLSKEIQDYICADYLAKAKAAWLVRDSETAVLFLAKITSDSKCYEEASLLAKEIEDLRCTDYLAKAQAAWASRNSNAAASYLAYISSDSKCYAEAKNLQKEIGINIDDKEKRNWEQYQKEHAEEVAYRKQVVNAVKEIGVAQAKQPINITYKTLW